MLGVASSARATPIQFCFNGRVTDVFGSPSRLEAVAALGVVVDADVVGTYTFESETPDRFPNDPTVGAYGDAVLALELEIGLFRVTLNPQRSLNQISVDPFRYHVVAGVEPDPTFPSDPFVEIGLNNYPIAIFPDDSLPLEPPDPLDFAATFSAYDDNPLIYFDVTRIWDSAYSGPSPPESCGIIPPDFDGDGTPDTTDNCPTVPNTSQSDFDGDGVGDLCDTCAALANPVFTGTPTPNMAFVSGQREDDGDGIGNRCDFKYGTSGSLIAPLDVSHMRSSVFSLLSLNTCGLSGAANCAQFDHDEVGTLVGPLDVSLLRGKVFQTNGPSCGPACDPLTPFSGPLGSGNEILGKAICTPAANC